MGVVSFRWMVGESSALEKKHNCCFCGRILFINFGVSSVWSQHGKIKLKKKQKQHNIKIRSFPSSSPQTELICFHWVASSHCMFSFCCCRFDMFPSPQLTNTKTRFEMWIVKINWMKIIELVIFSSPLLHIFQLWRGGGWIHFKHKSHPHLPSTKIRSTHTLTCHTQRNWSTPFVFTPHSSNRTIIIFVET